MIEFDFKKASGFHLLHNDLFALTNKYPDSEFLFGLYEVASALHYWSAPNRGRHWMLFYVMTPAWRQDQ